jgi:hypothetical protein
VVTRRHGDLTQAVLEVSGGELSDDATALCLDWHGRPHPDGDADHREQAPDLPCYPAGTVPDYLWVRDKVPRE